MALSWVKQGDHSFLQTGLCPLAELAETYWFKYSSNTESDIARSSARSLLMSLRKGCQRFQKKRRRPWSCICMLVAIRQAYLLLIFPFREGTNARLWNNLSKSLGSCPSFSVTEYSISKLAMSSSTASRRRLRVCTCVRGWSKFALRSLQQIRLQQAPHPCQLAPWKITQPLQNGILLHHLCASATFGVNNTDWFSLFAIAVTLWIAL